MPVGEKLNLDKRPFVRIEERPPLRWVGGQHRVLGGLVGGGRRHEIALEIKNVETCIRSEMRTRERVADGRPEPSDCADKRPPLISL